jgi:hypothetical protein
VNLHKDFDGKVKLKSMYRRIQRFFNKAKIDADFTCLFILPSILSIFEQKSIILKDVDFDKVQEEYMHFITERIYNSLKAK